MQIDTGMNRLYNTENNLLSGNVPANKNYLENEVFSGIDWIYSYVETVYTYDFKITYFNNFNSFFDESCDYFYNIFWFFIINNTVFQLF